MTTRSKTKPRTIGVTGDERRHLESLAGSVSLGRWIPDTLAKIAENPQATGNSPRVLPPEGALDEVIPFRMDDGTVGKIDKIRGSIPRRAWMRDMLMRWQPPSSGVGGPPASAHLTEEIPNMAPGDGGASPAR